MLTKRNHVRSALDIAVVAPVGLVVIVSCAVAGCQSRSASGPPGSATTHVARSIDACSMLSPQDVSALLGTTVPGKSTGKQPDMGGCSWENPTT